MTWNDLDLHTYPFLGRTFRTLGGADQVHVSSFDEKSGKYRCVRSGSHGWSLISSEHLLDRWVEVKP